MECEPHRAQLWTAEVKGKIAGRFPTKAKAEQELASAWLRAEGPKRSPKPGSRAPKKAAK